MPPQSRATPDFVGQEMIKDSSTANWTGRDLSDRSGDSATPAKAFSPVESSLLHRAGPKKLGRDEILSAEVGMIDELEKPQVPVCNEVRGGNHKFIGTRKLSGMVAWVASIPINEGGGDVHFMSVCSHDLISRIALADVSGMVEKSNAAAMTLQGEKESAPLA